MPFRRKSDLVPGIDLPQMPITTLRDKVHKAAERLDGDARVFVFGCEHGVRADKLASDRCTGLDLPCAGMLPPSFVDYILSKNLADGVAVVGCSAGECQYRLGAAWIDARFEGRRDPHLRARVDRERVSRIWVTPVEWRRARNEIDALADRLETLPKRSEKQHRPREPEIVREAGQ